MKTLKNDILSIKVDRHGAELCSIRDHSGREFIWQADPAFWKRHAPVLFPIVGSLWEKRYRIDGKEYTLGQHGFARDMDFHLISSDENTLWYELQSDAETLAKYPYAFTLRIGYKLNGNKIQDEYQDLLRITVASAGNDHRLGANEAPPAIISMYLGDDLGELVDSIINDREYVSKGKQKMRTGVDVLPDFMKDTSDRNRTSPFAFTGNKFEFRALGSSLNIACPNYMLNTMVAEELSEFYDELKDADDMDAAIKALVKKVFTEHQNIIFNGNNYAPEWVEEAERRGLLNLKSLPDAMEHFLDKKNIDLFVKNKICSADEIRARYEIELESYSKQINIEALTMIDMAKKNILPAVTSYVRDLTDTALAKKALSDAIPTSVEEDLITSLSNKLVCFSKKTAELEEAVIKASDYSDDNLKYAKYYRETVFALMQELRAVGDAMETETASEYWPYPSYGELLFGV